MAESGLKIGEVAEQTGLSIPTLRHYDTVGLISPSTRSPGGFRLYSETDIHRILLVRRMKPLGFTLDEMRTFLTATDTLQERNSPRTQQDMDQARESISRIREDIRNRYSKLRKQLTYAEEFLDLVEELGA